MPLRAIRPTRKATARRFGRSDRRRAAGTTKLSSGGHAERLETPRNQHRDRRLLARPGSARPTSSRHREDDRPTCFRGLLVEPAHVQEVLPGVREVFVPDFDLIVFVRIELIGSASASTLWLSWRAQKRHPSPEERRRKKPCTRAREKAGDLRRYSGSTGTRR